MKLKGGLMEISGKGSLIPKKEILEKKKKELALPLDIVHLDESARSSVAILPPTQGHMAEKWSWNTDLLNFS